MNSTSEDDKGNILIRFNFDKETNIVRNENQVEIEDENVYHEIHEIPYERPEKELEDNEHSSDDIMQFAEIKDVESIYQCSVCQYSTDNSKSLKKHQSTMHYPGRNFKCKFCLRRFSSQIQSHIHVQKKHSKKFHKCPYCTHTTILGKKDMEKHVTEVHPGCEYGQNTKFDGFIRVGSKGLYRCEMCSYVNRKLEPMQHHAKMHKIEFTLKCLHCHFLADSQTLYRQHLEKAHKLAKEIYICKKCYFQTEDQNEYTDHIIEPHNNHKCSECSFSTPDVDIFRAHFDLHKNKNNKCSKCSYIDENEQNLKEHFQVHHQGQIQDNKISEVQNEIEIQEFIEGENLDISEEKLRDAINGVQNKIISITEASTIFQIPIDYLYNRIRYGETVEFPNKKLVSEPKIETHAGESEEDHNDETDSTEREQNMLKDKDIRSTGRFVIEPIRGFPNLSEEKTKNSEEFIMKTIANLKVEPLETDNELDAAENIDENALDINKQLIEISFTIDEDQNGKNYKCKLCSFKTSEKNLVTSHLENEHSKKEILKCPHCPHLIISDSEKFQQHLDQHCSHCSFQSADMNKLKLHILSHVPRYRSTNTKENSVDLKEEIRIIIEGNEKTNSSEHEGIQLIVDNSLIKIKNYEEDESFNIIGRPIKVIKIFKNQCFDCLNIYKSRYCLVDHRKRYHNLRKPHSCTYCMEVFESYKNLKSHYYRVHQATFHNTGPIFKCPLCGFDSDLLKPITKHIVKNHKRTPTGFKTYKFR